MAILLMCVPRDTGRIGFPQVDGWSTDTPGFGASHDMVRVSPIR